MKVVAPFKHGFDIGERGGAAWFEGFAKTATESGINVSDRALPVVCEIERDPVDTTEEFNRLLTINPVTEVTYSSSEPSFTDAAADFNNAAEYQTDAPTNIRYDVFAVTDMIIYITADGSVSTRI